MIYGYTLIFLVSAFLCSTYQMRVTSFLLFIYLSLQNLTLFLPLNLFLDISLALSFILIVCVVKLNLPIKYKNIIQVSMSLPIISNVCVMYPHAFYVGGFTPWLDIIAFESVVALILTTEYSNTFKSNMLSVVIVHIYLIEYFWEYL